MNTAFTYLITDGQKYCQAAEEIRSKNYHIILNTVYIYNNGDSKIIQLSVSLTSSRL